MSQNGVLLYLVAASYASAIRDHIPRGGRWTRRFFDAKAFSAGRVCSARVLLGTFARRLCRAPPLRFVPNINLLSCTSSSPILLPSRAPLHPKI